MMICRGYVDKFLSFFLPFPFSTSSFCLSTASVNCFWLKQSRVAYLSTISILVQIYEVYIFFQQKTVENFIFFADK